MIGIVKVHDFDSIGKRDLLMPQVNAAADLGVSSSPLLAAQTAGASAGSMISPSKIILGTTAGGVPGEEGTVLRFTLLTAAILTLVTGVICWIIL